MRRALSRVSQCVVERRCASLARGPGRSRRKTSKSGGFASPYSGREATTCNNLDVMERRHKKEPQAGYALGVVRSLLPHLGFWAGCRGRKCRPARPNKRHLAMRRVDSTRDPAR